MAELTVSRGSERRTLTFAPGARLGEVLRAHGIEAEGAAGFSLGEYAALAHAGSIALADVLSKLCVLVSQLRRVPGTHCAAHAASIPSMSGMECSVSP